ncbi:MAG: hypothetical protein M3167_12945 [Acidobacteriota bacterium]|nr:hypothetical protein [Acidobacteriota bacterium]
MKLVWSQPASSADRPRSLLLLGVVCIFFGGAVVGRPGPESPRLFRAAAASLVGTGLLVCLAGGVSLALQRRRPGPALTLADPSRPASDGDGLREEEQR